MSWVVWTCELRKPTLSFRTPDVPTGCSMAILGGPCWFRCIHPGHFASLDHSGEIETGPLHTFRISVLGMLTQVQLYNSIYPIHPNPFYRNEERSTKNEYNESGSWFSHKMFIMFIIPGRHFHCRAAHLGHDLLQTCIHRILGDHHPQKESRRFQEPKLKLEVPTINMFGLFLRPI